MFCSTAALQSPAFARLTNRATPALSHPTSANFDAATWGAFVEHSGDLPPRDLELASSAMYFAALLSHLRKGPLATAFDGLSQPTLVRLAVAQANRAFLITRGRVQTALNAIRADTNRVTSMEAQIATGGSILQPDLSADEVNTHVIDTLPHWFAQALSRGAAEDAPNADLRAAGIRGEGLLSVERGYRNLWQSVLWEGHEFSIRNGRMLLGPGDHAGATLWAAWEYRQQALNTQTVQHRISAVRAGAAPKAGPGFLAQSVVRVRRQGAHLRLNLGPASVSSRSAQEFEMEIVGNSYLGMFLDEPLTSGPTPVTPRLLLLADFVLRDIANLIARDIKRTEIEGPADVRALSMPVRATALRKAFKECLAITYELAAALLATLTCDPTDLASAFRDGVWHRPLIAVGPRSAEDLLLVAGAIVAGSPIRKIERWLVAGGKADTLSKGSRGLAYEAAVRQRLSAALKNNPLLTDAACAPHAIARGRAGEEIDLVVRIGRVVIVGEIKCFLVPSESIERYNHLAKLEEAAQQANRKVAWLKQNPAALEAAIGSLPCAHNELTYVPMVVLNHSVGVGLSLSGCIVTDAHFLELYLGDGSYQCSALIDTDGTRYVDEQHLYTSQAQAESQLLAIFSAPPGVERYRRAIRWRWDPFPTPSDFMLLAAYTLDDEALRTPDFARLAASLVAKGDRAPRRRR